MGINIKNPETERLIRELAAITGQSQTAVVTDAVRERLHRFHRERDLADRLLAIGRACAPHWKEPYKSIDHGDLFYDEEGLPK
jgi:antitoxin VapB